MSATSAFRRLLRLCRHFDREPTWQLGLVGRPPRQYDWNFNRAVRTRFHGSPFAEEMVWEASGFSTQFAMPQRDGSVARACRRHFRRSMAMGLPYSGEATRLLKRFNEAKQLVEGLGPWTEHSEHPRLLKSFDSGGHQQVQRGDLLLAHPMSCIRDPNFDQALLLIHATNQDEVKGLVVNKPHRNYNLHQLLKRAELPEDKEWAEAILSQDAIDDITVFRGGPIIVGGSLQRNLHWLHGFSTVSGALEVSPGLWMGGNVLEILQKANTAGQPCWKPLRVCFGHAEWSDLQLRLELESGQWTRARALDAEVSDARSDGLSVMASACLSDWQMAWQRALLHAGLPELANFPRNSKADAKLRLHISQQEAKERGEKTEARTKEAAT